MGSKQVGEEVWAQEVTHGGLSRVLESCRVVVSLGWLTETIAARLGGGGDR